MKALIDGDLFAYRCSASAENDGLQIAIDRMESLLDTCLQATGADEFEFYLTGENNFRYDIYPEYKANRKDLKPIYLAGCRAFLAVEYNATFSDGCEADDLLGVNQSNDTIIVSLDKDLLQIPGKHFQWKIEGGKAEKRWVKEEKHYDIDPITGARNFYLQMLIGDSTDNIKGVAGIGPKRAHALLDDVINPQTMFNIVREQYGFDKVMLMNGRCLHIWRTMGDIWKFPYETTDTV